MFSINNLLTVFISLKKKKKRQNFFPFMERVAICTELGWNMSWAQSDIEWSSFEPGRGRNGEWKFSLLDAAHTFCVAQSQTSLDEGRRPFQRSRRIRKNERRVRWREKKKESMYECHQICKIAYLFALGAATVAGRGAGMRQGRCSWNDKQGVPCKETGPFSHVTVCTSSIRLLVSSP